MTIWQDLRRTFSRVPVQTLLEDELYETQRELLTAQAAKELNDAKVEAYRMRASRLRAQLETLKKENAA